MRKRDPDGSLIAIRWDDECAVTEWYVRGHVPAEEAIATVRAELEAEAEDGERDHVPALGFGGHEYARWGLGQDEDGCSVARRFYSGASPGRGAFRVTTVIDLDDLSATRRAREAERAHAADLEAWVLACYPEATDIRAHGYPPGEGHAWFRLPELDGGVYLRATDDHKATIQHRDLETWGRLYGPRSKRLRMTFAEFVAGLAR